MLCGEGFFTCDIGEGVEDDAPNRHVVQVVDDPDLPGDQAVDHEPEAAREVRDQAHGEEQLDHLDHVGPLELVEEAHQAAQAQQARCAQQRKQDQRVLVDALGECEDDGIEGDGRRHVDGQPRRRVPLGDLPSVPHQDGLMVDVRGAEVEGDVAPMGQDLQPSKQNKGS